MHRVLIGMIAALLGATSLAIASADGGALAPSASAGRDVEVTYPGASSGVELAGTLTLPNGETPR